MEMNKAIDIYERLKEVIHDRYKHAAYRVTDFHIEDADNVTASVWLKYDDDRDEFEDIKVNLRSGHVEILG